MDGIVLKYTICIALSMSEEMSEMDMMRQVASDRLGWLRLLEKAVNDIDMIMGNLKRDVAEISQQVAARNQDMTLEPAEISEENEEDEN